MSFYVSHDHKLSIPLPKQLAETLQRVAHAESNTTSGTLRRLITDALRRERRRLAAVEATDQRSIKG